MSTITPKGWDSFQHYKDRKPAWIKLHRDLLDNFEFHCLPIASKALAPCLWLLASEYEGGNIPADWRLIAFRLRMTAKEVEDAVTPLISSGFFIASESLADGKRIACLEKERETEGETETERDSAPTGAVSSPAGDDPSADAGRVDTPKADPVPYQQIVDAYHELLPMLPRVVTLTDRRKTAIRARWKSGELPDVQTWRAYFADVSASDFLCGRVQPSPGRKTFVADIDFLINQANFVKFQEGKYDNERGGRRG